MQNIPILNQTEISVISESEEINYLRNKTVQKEHEGIGHQLNIK